MRIGILKLYIDNNTQLNNINNERNQIFDLLNSIIDHMNIMDKKIDDLNISIQTLINT